MIVLFLLLFHGFLIQGQVKFENMDPWFAQDTKLSSLGVPAYKTSHRLFAHSALAGNPWNLKLSRCRADVRVKS